MTWIATFVASERTSDDLALATVVVSDLHARMVRDVGSMVVRCKDDRSNTGALVGSRL